jgi:hypothetical protein
MKDDLIKTFLYQEVMRLAFEVTDKSLRDQWIVACLGSFQQFWGVEYPPCTNPRSPLTLKVGEFDMNCKITITTLDDFCVIINSVAHRNEELILRHEVHSSLQQDFIIPYSFTPPQCAEVRAKYTTEQLGKVIDYMLLHPFVHFHIKGPINPKNNIRLGGGISNVLQYLFHLRYQLCPEAIRQPKSAGANCHPERNRLITLFDAAIKSGKNAIQHAELMKVP